MGGVFSDGMISYLKEQGWKIEVAIHFNAWEPHKIRKRSGTTLVDATVTNDWVQWWGTSATTNDGRNIRNTDYTIRKQSDKSYQYVHRDLIDNGDIWNTGGSNTWNQVMSVLQSWLQENPNIKVSYE